MTADDAYTGSIETPSSGSPGAAAPATQRIIRRPDGSRLDPRQDLGQASPTGFAWGCGGSGPAQTALAILADCTGDDALALKLCQAFKWHVVSRLPVDRGWALSVDEVRRWVRRHEPWATTQVPWARHDLNGDNAVDIP
jgi:Family of unknown function (DUF6166)